MNKHKYRPQQNSAMSPKKWLENNTVHRSKQGSELFDGTEIFLKEEKWRKELKFGESQIATISREPEKKLEQENRKIGGKERLRCGVL